MRMQPIGDLQIDMLGGTRATTLTILHVFPRELRARDSVTDEHGDE
jgi:hypothetical protein